jgi:hypothetical protein
MHLVPATNPVRGKAVLLPLLLALSAGCGGGGYSTKLTVPQEGKMLLIGAVIIENVGYSNLREAYTRDIEVSIMADIEEAGKTVRKAITIFADTDGYFCVENVEPGRYTLKGVRAFTPGGDWTIYNELRMPNERWVIANAAVRYPFTGEYFYFTPVLDVYNFNYNIFSVLPGGEARYANRTILENESFYLSETYTRGMVEEYFIKKYPDSGWVPILQQLLPDK